MKLFSKIGMLAVAALAFFGCSKEIAVQSADSVSGTHKVTFSAQKSFDTKTAVVEGDKASYVWSEGDEAYFVIFENGEKATDVEMKSLSSDKKIATFVATFADTDATEFSYTAVYGSNLSNSGNPLIAANQAPALDSFDPAADVMVSAEAISLPSAADENTEFKFTLDRVVSVNKMTLKGLVPGETISTVELASDKYFSSRYMVEKGSFENANGSQKLTFDFSGKSAVVGEDGTFPVYFVTAPVENATFSVRVVTDQNIYYRDNFTSKLTFAAGTFRRFGINLEGYSSEIQEGVEYTLVTKAEEIVDGAEYLIVCPSKSVAAASFNSSDYYNKEDVTIDNDAITITSEAVQIFTLEEGSDEGQFFMKDSEGYYLYWNSGNSVNRAQSKGGEKYLWTFSLSSDEGTCAISNVGDNTRLLKYNSGSPRFACYTSAQTAVALYVNKSTIVNLSDPEISFGEEEIEVAWSEIEDFTVPVLNNPNNLTVTYTSSNPEVATVDASIGTITFVGNGETVITASSEKTSEYKAGTAQYTLTVTGAPTDYDFETIAELNDLVTSTSAKFTGVLTDAVVSFVAAANTAIIKDATGSIMYFKSGHGLKQGQTLSGEITVDAILYKEQYSEITSFNDGSAEFTGSEAVVEPQVVTLSQLISAYSSWQNAYVKAEGLTVVSQSGQNINVTDGTNTYVVYDNTKNIAVSIDDVITVEGTVTRYINNSGTSVDEIKVWAADDLTITQHTADTHTISFTQPTVGGSFTVTVKGTAVNDGDEYMEGTVVTLTATAAEGYTFTGWTVTGATVSGNTETATFTVGTEDVTIAASFKSNSSTSKTEEIAGTFTSTNSNLSLTTESGITIVQAKGTGTNAVNANYNTASTLRMYKGHTLTFSGKTITRIEITVNGTYYGNSLSADCGTLTPTSTSGGVIVWEGSSESVTITNVASASNVQLRPSKIVVTYK